MDLKTGVLSNRPLVLVRAEAALVRWLHTGAVSQVPAAEPGSCKAGSGFFLEKAL